ncbi:MAG TPA: Spy/CpxP family protein refolding chaperone, partial [Allocoleopsis sp.]
GKIKGGMMKELGLTPDQMQKIQAINTKYKPDMVAKGKVLKTAMEEMRTLMKNSSATKEQLKTQQRKVQAAHNDMMNLKFDSMLEVREILTPEQRTKFTQMMQDKKGKFGGDHRGVHKK